MKKLFAVVVCVVVCLFAVPAFAQEKPATKVPAAEGSVVAEQPSAREILEQGLTVEPGATANVNLNENVINVPKQPAPVVKNKIVIPDKYAVTRADMGFCERNPMTCALTGVAVVAAGFFVADQFGAFDSTNTVSYR